MVSAQRKARKRTLLHLEELEIRAVPTVYMPSQIQTAYNFTPLYKAGITGAGQTIAIVDAYFDPSIQNDIKAFSTQFHLPQLDGLGGDGTFTQIDLSHGTLSPPNDDWTLETALDVEWAHAIAPKANIVLVEAASDNLDPVTSEPTDLLNAVQYAATQTGASTVSMSWGLGEVPNELNWDSFFTTNQSTGAPITGVTFVAASGDSGAGTIWPSASPYVLSVGGTTLKLTSSNTIKSETGWGNGSLSWLFGGSGGGISPYESLPSYQNTSAISSTYTQYGHRLNPDVAYDANPNTGYYVLDGADGGWYQVGGTSAGAPQWAALISLVNQDRGSAGSLTGYTQTLPGIYKIYSNPTLYKTDFHDITSGNNGYPAGKGFDLVTGVGTPNAGNLVPELASIGKTGGLQLVQTSSSTTSGGSGHTPHHDIPVAGPSQTFVLNAVPPGSSAGVVVGNQVLNSVPASQPPLAGGTTTAPVSTLNVQVGALGLREIQMPVQNPETPSEAPPPDSPTPNRANPPAANPPANPMPPPDIDSFFSTEFQAGELPELPELPPLLDAPSSEFLTGAAMSAFLLGMFLPRPPEEWRKRRSP